MLIAKDGNLLPFMAKKMSAGTIGHFHISNLTLFEKGLHTPEQLKGDLRSSELVADGMFLWMMHNKPNTSWRTWSD